MSILTIGLLVLFLGVAFMSLPNLNRALKQHDREQWERLIGSHSRFMAYFDRLTLFSWTLQRRFEVSDNVDIQYEGYQAYKQATRVKYMLIFGLTMVAIGGYFSLFAT
ncbi:hypothetical protein [Shewanella youngdeokensis]|uniref:Uncharacterized protein n=1 Tax=Shewanella youngdeokensis TaxID=2999068 RepID=A0ABZ0JXX2_9GAMM|nr:hypothetical protein RGE70_15515 [Shewanella sp. DAU334]